MTMYKISKGDTSWGWLPLSQFSKVYCYMTLQTNSARLLFLTLVPKKYYCPCKTPFPYGNSNNFVSFYPIFQPQNIVLMGQFPNCEIKLCDLEVARVIQEGESVREIIGTPDYVGEGKI